MGQKFCTGCGDALPDGVRFCESCGAPVGYDDPAPGTPGLLSTPAADSAEHVSPPVPVAGKFPGKPVAIIAVILILASFTVFVIVPAVSPGMLHGSPVPIAGVPVTTGSPETTGTAPQTPVLTPATPPPTPTPAPDPFPGALMVKDSFPFGEGSPAGVGTVYRVWINDSYTWHNDQDNNYYLQRAAPGSKYLFLFVNVYNAGDTRFWPPSPYAIHVLYDNREFYQDPTHFIPNKGLHRDETPIEVKEIQYYSKLSGSEYVEDYGYSHGSQLAYLYPGKNNAVDGYLIYVVPASLAPDKAYAKIEFNGKDTGIWRIG